MIKLAIAATLLLSLSSVVSAAQLTEVETRWLTAGSAVLAYAKQELKLPIDITVQPQSGPTDVPLALGFQDGRCKLVLSMRGNPGAEDILSTLAPAQRGLMIEAMVAHEIGHCWRYAQGVWHVLPAGFVTRPSTGTGGGVTPDVVRREGELRATRREEGYADLVALAWTQQRHPEQYAAVAAWLRTVREPAADAAPGSHDTLAWLQLAPTGAAFPAAPSPFEQAASLWRRGLSQEE